MITSEAGQGVEISAVDVTGARLLIKVNALLGIPSSSALLDLAERDLEKGGEDLNMRNRGVSSAYQASVGSNPFAQVTTPRILSKIPRHMLLESWVTAFLRDAGAPGDLIQKVVNGIAPPHYIEAISGYAISSNNKAGAEVNVVFDWSGPASLVVSGSGISTEWNALSEEFLAAGGELSRRFSKFVKDNDLRVEWAIKIDPRFDRQAVCEKLGFVETPMVEWEPIRIDPADSVVVTTNWID